MGSPIPATANPPSTPRWVKLLALVALVVILLFVALHLTGAAPTGH
jgi:hypothetical protein